MFVSIQYLCVSNRLLKNIFEKRAVEPKYNFLVVIDYGLGWKEARTQ